MSAKLKVFLKTLYVLEKLFYWPARTVMSVSIFLYYLRVGIIYGYPLCCVLHFSFEGAIGGNKQAIRRGIVDLAEDKGYVPCFYHKGRHPKWEPVEDQGLIPLSYFETLIR